MLKMTWIELELISDIDTCLFVKKRLTKRFSKAYNKYMKSYDDEKPGKYITYLDANNLHGRKMSKYLHYGGFKWLNQKEIDSLLLNMIGKNSSDGYMLEVDLEYLHELHELHNDYLLAPEKLEISYMLSTYYSNIVNKYGIQIGGVNKLDPNLGN